MTRSVEPEYQSLAEVLDLALADAQAGKGKERHASDGQSFLDQGIVREGLEQGGPGFQIGQARKKALEALRLPPDAAIRELLGGINYLAAAVIVIERTAAGVWDEVETAPRTWYEAAAEAFRAAGAASGLADDDEVPAGFAALEQMSGEELEEAVADLPADVVARDDDDEPEPRFVLRSLGEVEAARTRKGHGMEDVRAIWTELPHKVDRWEDVSDRVTTLYAFGDYYRDRLDHPL